MHNDWDVPHSHYNDVIMGAMASQITSLTIVYSTVYSRKHQRKHQSSASLAFVRGIHRWPVNSPHKGPVTRKMFPFDDVIMLKTFVDLSYVCMGNLQCLFTSLAPGRCGSNSVNIIIKLNIYREWRHGTHCETAPGLDTNGCPLGNSKFILVSDNLNICLWLSACQVKKINQINNPWSTIY